MKRTKWTKEQLSTESSMYSTPRFIYATHTTNKHKHLPRSVIPSLPQGELFSTKKRGRERASSTAGGGGRGGQLKQEKKGARREWKKGKKESQLSDKTRRQKITRRNIVIFKFSFLDDGNPGDYDPIHPRKGQLKDCPKE